VVLRWPYQTGADGGQGERLRLFAAANDASVLGSTVTTGRSIIRQLMAAMPNEFASPLEVLASVTHTSADNWETLGGPDSGVGVDYWYRHRGTGKEAYLNRDQDHLTISVDEEKLYDAEVPAGTGPIKAHTH
jgi:hypothetical protein